LASKKEVKKKGLKKPVKKTPAARSIKSPDKVLSEIKTSIVSEVVQTLVPEINNAVTAKYVEMKKSLVDIFTNELKDIRSHMEASPQPETELPNMSLNDAGLTQPQAQEKAGLDSLLPIIQMLGLGTNQQGGGLNNMFMEAIMRKSLADITRGDMMNEKMSKAMYKKLSGGDEMPQSINDTTDSLMNPLRKYGENSKKS
jgi:hypothetical protein